MQGRKRKTGEANLTVFKLPTYRKKKEEKIININIIDIRKRQCVHCTNNCTFDVARWAKKT